MRYRDNACGVTNVTLRKMGRAIAKLGRIKSIRGYRYIGRYNVDHEAVLVRGENGTARFEGVLWGYYGEGPAGLVQLLERCGVDKERARLVAYSTHRRCPTIGTDWTLDFSRPALTIE